MKNYKPYINWTRADLLSHCKRQLMQFGCDDMYDDIKEIIYSELWNPMFDYNGCSVIQDKFHPYVPCLIHDYRWIVGEGGKEADIEFKNNLELFGTPNPRRQIMWIGVRIGWFFSCKRKRQSRKKKQL